MKEAGLQRKVRMLYCQWKEGAQMGKRGHDEAAGWRVCFDGGFWTQKGRAGQELRLDRSADWDNRTVYIPSAYLCGKGIVLDILTRAEPEAIRAFAEKWSLSPESDGSELTSGQRELCMAENPLRVGYSPTLCVNGKRLKAIGGSGFAWNPVFQGENCKEEHAALEHYGLDTSVGWMLMRWHFAWVTKRRPKHGSMILTLHADETLLDGPQFTIAPGEHIAFTHPVSGVRHTLTALSLDAETVGRGRQEMSRVGVLRHPMHTQRLTYTISPDLPETSFTLRDSAPPDPVRLESGAGFSGAVGVIGGADGPTALYLHSDGDSEAHEAYSAVTDAPRGTVVWELLFRKAPCTDLTMELLC